MRLLENVHQATWEAMTSMQVGPPPRHNDVRTVHVYVDGTAGATVDGSRKGEAAAGFCVFYELCDGKCTFGGFDGCVIATDQAHNMFFGATVATNGTAEVTATLLATLWMLQSGYHSFHLGFDSKYADAVASAVAKPKTNVDLVNVTAAMRETLRKKCLLVAEHVYSHRGHPWNELADVVCDTISLRTDGFSCRDIPCILREAVSC